MRSINRADFDAMRKTDPSYYRESRWAYYVAAIKLVDFIAPKSVIEVGPHKLPLYFDSTVMDMRRVVADTVVHDARVSPWPFSDKQFDCLVALQVWEHLSGAQAIAFAEVARVSRYAVMSFPLEWECPNDPMHHMITTEDIDRWTLGHHPIKQEVVTTHDSKLRRLLRVYRF